MSADTGERYYGHSGSLVFFMGFFKDNNDFFVC